MKSTSLAVPVHLRTGLPSHQRLALPVTSCCRISLQLVSDDIVTSTQESRDDLALEDGVLDNLRDIFRAHSAIVEGRAGREEDLQNHRRCSYMRNGSERLSYMR